MEKMACLMAGWRCDPQFWKGLVGWVYNKPSGWVKHLLSCKYKCVGRDGDHLSPTLWSIRCSEGHSWGDPGTSVDYAVCEARIQRRYSHSDTNRAAYMKLAVMPSLQTSPHRCYVIMGKSNNLQPSYQFFKKLSTRAEVQGGQDMREQA